MLMRVALCVHGRDAPAVLQAYDLMSRGLFTHATPTMFNAGCPRQQVRWGYGWGLGLGVRVRVRVRVSSSWSAQGSRCGPWS